jgi:group II intron reverse transcriptase/maturase
LNGIRHCVSNGRKAEDLFKIITTCEDLWMQAYINIRANKGSMTVGVDQSTADGFSSELSKVLVNRLRDGNFRFKPARRVYIPKTNGKLRPLGIPTFQDKLVQEVCRMILETIYEPLFSNCSYGFRPNRSCHKALQEVKKWNGTGWFIEYDIKGYFDNIDHKILMCVLEKKIDDRRFLKLIREMLKCGYMEDWKYNKTYSGSPQGGVISPILSNIYLHELDKFVESLKMDFNKENKQKRPNPEYREITKEKACIREKIRRRKEWMKTGFQKHGKCECMLSDEKRKQTQTSIIELQDRYKELDKAQKMIPSIICNDLNCRRLRYVRYADDFLMGLVCHRSEAVEIMSKIEQFLKEKLNLDISAEKTGIKHAREEGTRFLSYDILISNNRKLRWKINKGIRYKQRTSAVAVRLEVPWEKVQKFTQKYGDLALSKALHRPELLTLSDVELVLRYNSELRGIANYYALADDIKTKFNKAFWIAQTSFLRTLANKYQTSVNKIVKRLKKNNHFVIVSDKTGKHNEYPLFKLIDLIGPKSSIVDQQPKTYQACTELEDRLAASHCEYCEKDGGYFEVHHIRRLKDIATKTKDWQRRMMERRRKTMILCIHCHHDLHNGKLSDLRYIIKGKV